jgi:cytochrome b6-f complex iron-sulfur subunit
MQRRQLLKGFISLVLGMFSMSLLGVVAFIYPKANREKTLTYIAVLEVHDLPKRYVKKVEYQYKERGEIRSARVYIAPYDNSFIALSPVCTHLGCLVNWDSINKEFICPCHAGRYDMWGNVVGGPPMRPLNRLPIKIRDDVVYIGLYL